MLTSRPTAGPAAAAVGLIGLGEIGQVHAAAIRRSPMARLVAGALGVVEANYFGPSWTFDDEIEIVGSDAILRLAGIESLYGGYRGGPALTIFRNGGWSEVPVPDDDWRSSVETSVITYLGAVTAGHEPPVTGADGLETVRLIHQIYDQATILNADPTP